MNIRIIRNSFVEPNLSRQNIVQGICDVILRRITIDRDNFCELTLTGEYPRLFYGEYCGTNPKDWPPYTITYNSPNSNYRYTRIRTCEMRLAFRHLQSAGYYIFYDDSRLRYIISVRPYYCQRKAEYTEFHHHID